MDNPETLVRFATQDKQTQNHNKAQKTKAIINTDPTKIQE
jgi:hypothetical protein